MQRLPVAGVQMVEAGERVLFVSDNGRYVFTGPAWDLWHGAKLETLEEGARLAARIDLKRLGLDPAALGALDLGSGEGEVVVFVDPRCPHCRRLLEQLPAFTENYRFRLVPLPVLGPDSETAVVRLGCLAEQDPSAAREALLAGNADQLPAPEGTCGQAPAQRALVTAQLLGHRRRAVPDRPGRAPAAGRPRESGSLAGGQGMRRRHLVGSGPGADRDPQGCAGLGEGDFACPGYPSKPLCLSTAEVYRLTDGYALPQPRAEAARRGNGAPAS